MQPLPAAPAIARQFRILFGGATTLLLCPVIMSLGASDASAASETRSKGEIIHLQFQTGPGTCAERLYGTSADDHLDGSKSDCDEQIFGYAGNDVLIGGRGNDTLNGGRGQDTLTGGRGSNTFVFSKAVDSTVKNADIIADFKESGSPTDYIDLRSVGKKAGVKLSFIGDTPFTGKAGEVNYHIIEYWQCDKHGNCQDVYATLLEADLSGSGSPDFCVQLSGQHTLTKANLLLNHDAPTA